MDLSIQNNAEHQAKLEAALADVRRHSECLLGRKWKRRVMLVDPGEPKIADRLEKQLRRHKSKKCTPNRQTAKPAIFINDSKQIQANEQASAVKPADSKNITPHLDPVKAERLQLIKEAAMRIQARAEAKQQ